MTIRCQLAAALFLLVVCLSPATALAQDQVSLNWVRMSLELIGGLALFLLGIDRLADGLRIAAGDQIRNVLSRFTSNRILGAVSGAGVTALIQSSSVTTVLVVGFVSAGLMSLTQSIGVIFGANVGTTVTAQIAAFHIGEEALPLIAIGFLMTGLLRTPAARHTGTAILGLGLLFFGMEIMGDAMRPLRTYEPFLNLMENLENPAYAIAIAALFTALVQSSSATTGIVIVMATEGVITVPLGIAFALGANIGTCATAGLAAIGKPVEAQRAAVVHVLFNITGALIWVLFIDELMVLALAISPSTPGLTGADLLAADAPRQIANANTLFNVINTMLFLPLAGVFASIVVRLVPERREPELLSLRYLNDELIETPAIALMTARLETQRMAHRVENMLNLIKPALRTGKINSTEISSFEDQVDWLRDKILGFLHQVAAEDLTLEDGEEFINTVKAVQSLERAADIIESDLTPTIKDNATAVLNMPEDLIRKAEAQLLRSYREIKKIKAGASEESYEDSTDEKDETASITDMPIRGARLKSAVADGVKLYRLEYDLMEALKRIRRHLHRARVQLEALENQDSTDNQTDTPAVAA